MSDIVVTTTPKGTSAGVVVGELCEADVTGADERDSTVASGPPGDDKLVPGVEFGLDGDRVFPSDKGGFTGVVLTFDDEDEEPGFDGCDDEGFVGPELELAEGDGVVMSRDDPGVGAESDG